MIKRLDIKRNEFRDEYGLATSTPQYEDIYRMRFLLLCVTVMFAPASSSARSEQVNGQGYIVEYRHSEPRNGSTTWDTNIHERILRKLSSDASAGARHYRALPAAHFPSMSSTDLALLANDPDIVGIYPNLVLEFYGTYSSYAATTTVAAVNGLPAFNGAGTSIAVLDTGLDYTHAEFGTCSAPGSPGCHVTRSFDIGPGDGMLDDASRHGTHTALIALRGAPAANIVSIDVAGADGHPTNDSTLSALDWIIVDGNDYNITAVNMSYGANVYSNSTDCTTLQGPFHTAYATLRSAGVLIVAAAGNSGVQKASEQACDMNVVNVGAIWWTDYVGGGSKLWTANEGLINCSDLNPLSFTVPCWSNSHNWLRLFAPGVEIAGFTGESANGTSGAAPQVAAGAAILRSVTESSGPLSNAAIAAKVEFALQTSRHVSTDHFGHSAPALDLVNAVTIAASVSYARIQALLGTYYGATPLGRMSDVLLMSLINDARQGASDSALLGKGIAPFVSIL